MPPSFEERLHDAQSASGSLVCVGLDPDPAKIPADLRDDPAPLAAFTRRIVDATMGIAAAYKPQIAFYSALGAERELAEGIRYIRERAPRALVILDAKRGDIGNTAEAYAREAFDRYGADAVTVNPYMGDDSVRPFLARPDRGAIVLCRTSNPGARDFQDLTIDGLPLYRRVAARAASAWNERRNLMLVVGATVPRELAELRGAHPELPFLVPGIGAQGGDLEADAGRGPRPPARRPPDQLLARDHLCRRRHGRRDPRRGARSQDRDRAAALAVVDGTTGLAASPWAVLESVGDGVAVTRFDGRLIYTSASLARLLGHTALRADSLDFRLARPSRARAAARRAARAGIDRRVPARIDRRSPGNMASRGRAQGRRRRRRSAWRSGRSRARSNARPRARSRGPARRLRRARHGFRLLGARRRHRHDSLVERLVRDAEYRSLHGRRAHATMDGADPSRRHRIG